MIQGVGVLSARQDTGKHRSSSFTKYNILICVDSHSDPKFKPVRIILLISVSKI